VSPHVFNRERFDTVLDYGVFHALNDDDRVQFVDSVRAVVSTAGCYHHAELQ
jgi:hypothetical protein